MPQQYRKADIQFCRGGASTIAEASAFGVVPLIVPLPAADDHQLRNAEVVVQNKAGFLFDQKKFSAAEFKTTLEFLLNNPAKRKEMATELRKLAPHQAARRIADDILSQI
jgi:UDP-N-acetylglucosamine--N-acetylmuramyl-(pentapeptide) pyrophosphoryl-undecaprenol N-acetylglucosamine transferase